MPADAPDAPDPSETDATAAPSEPEPTTASRLLALQAIDTESDKLRIRHERLAERSARADKAAALEEWERTLMAGEQRIAELNAIIERAERTGEEHAAQKVRFEQQLKTIISPREAEALMHEIETLDAQRDANETAELEALEEQSALEETLVAHRAAEQGHREALSAADAALAAALAEISALQDDIDARRAAVRGQLDEGTLRSYDRIRGQLGVAVAELLGKMCAGCHLDLSAAEVDTVRETAADGGGLADCPHCGRILVP